jgi:putative membrane protein (TIGR04086 family)
VLVSKEIFQVVKATFAAVIFSLIYVLLFSLIVQFIAIPQTAIKYVNQVFKVICIIAGGLIFVGGRFGILKGVIYGPLCVIFTYLLFGAIAGEFTFSFAFLIEVALGAVIGGITGIIAVNVKK